MRIHLVSDLHLDMDWVDSEELLRDWKAEGADLLIVAGDTYSKHRPDKLKDFFIRMLELYPKVLWIPGNHDLWHASPEEARANFEDARLGDGRIILATEPGLFVIDGHEIIAGTMWYPKPSKRKLQDFIDLQLVKAPKAWIFEQFRIFKMMVETLGTEKTIVVSHHLPSPNSTPVRFRGNPIDHFFMTNLTDTIMKVQPRLWLHGHTHDPCDYVMGKTRVVCNPRGNPHEYSQRAPYKPVLIEV